METTLGIITDIHYSSGHDEPLKRSNLADILLRKVVMRMNRFHQPAAVLVLGDLVEELSGEKKIMAYRLLKEQLDLLTCPYLVIPGNHDDDPADLYSVFPQPPEFFDLPGLRLVPFLDQQEPGYHASRSAADLERMHGARRGYGGKLAAFQHVCLGPSGRSDLPYNYTNADDVCAALAAAGFDLSLSGHEHSGAAPFRSGPTLFLHAPALCRPPFSYQLVTLNGGAPQVETLALALPEQLEMEDRHIHTPLAYCNDNMEVIRAVALARALGLKKIGFAEHSTQLYYSEARYRERCFYKSGSFPGHRDKQRVEEYFDLTHSLDRDFVKVGFELDFDEAGRGMILDEHRARADFLLGAVHYTPSYTKGSSKQEELEAEFLPAVRMALDLDVDILAHPFRLFSRGGCLVPEKFFDPVIKMLAETGTAAEINYHTDEPPPKFFQMCLERGIDVVCGSDAHDLYEIGEFYPHRRLLKRIGAL